MDVALLLFLVFLNALFAMSETALTASRKARLQVMVEAGDSGASHALAQGLRKVRVSAIEKQLYVANGFLINLRRSQAGNARSQAAPDIKLQARPRM